MRHGLRTAKLGRPTAHRVLMLRNLVSSLLQHEQVTTTLPKAKAAQKLADQVIHWGKTGGKSNWDRANAFLLNPKDTLRPLFTTFAARYASRPGGYTRIQRAGFRVGDNAPIAVLELVDGANDLRHELAARTLGREMAVHAREGGDAARGAWREFRTRVEAQGPESVGELVGKEEALERLTRDNVVKALRYRHAPVAVGAESLSDASAAVDAPAGEVEGAPAAAVAQGATVTAAHPATLFLDRAYHHYLSSLAAFSLASARAPDPLRSVKQLTQRLGDLELRGAPRPVLTVPSVGRTPRAGERTDAWEATLDAAEEISRVGGPISRAKGNKGRESRARGTGRKADAYEEEEVAAAVERVLQHQQGAAQ
ncbi:54S ribosomal protein L8, mitochondrial [Rhodotorula kratochvilovae]